MLSACVRQTHSKTERLGGNCGIGDRWALFLGWGFERRVTLTFFCMGLF